MRFDKEVLDELYSVGDVEEGCEVVADEITDVDSARCRVFTRNLQT